MKAALSMAEAEAEQIVERMRSVRTAGHDHVVELQVEAKRLVDWKEYVRAKPILSVAAASLLGFSIVRQATSSISKPSSPTLVSGDVMHETKSFRSTITNSVATLATSFVMNAIKSTIANMMESANSKGDSNDRLRQDIPKD